jgi:hypothetical protein
VDEISQAVEDERQANSDEAREKAQTRSINLHREFVMVTGLRSIKRRRIVAHMQGRGAAADVTEEAFPDTLEDISGVAGRRKARAIAAMAIYDCDLLEPRVAWTVAGGLYAASKGQPPLTGNEPGLHGGVLFEPEALMGKSAVSALEVHLQDKVVDTLGYESGVRGLSANKRLIPELLNAATKYLRDMSRDPRSKGMALDKSAETIRRWCTATGTPTRENFEAAYRQGREDAAAGRVDPSRRLSSLKVPPRK